MVKPKILVILLVPLYTYPFPVGSVEDSDTILRESLAKVKQKIEPVEVQHQELQDKLLKH